MAKSKTNSSKNLSQETIDSQVDSLNANKKQTNVSTSIKTKINQIGAPSKNESDDGPVNTTLDSSNQSFEQNNQSSLIDISKKNIQNSNIVQHYSRSQKNKPKNPQKMTQENQTQIYSKQNDNQLNNASYLQDLQTMLIQINISIQKLKKSINDKEISQYMKSSINIFKETKTSLDELVIIFQQRSHNMQRQDNILDNRMQQLMIQQMSQEQKQLTQNYDQNSQQDIQSFKNINHAVQNKGIPHDMYFNHPINQHPAHYITKVICEVIGVEYNDKQGNFQKLITRQLQHFLKIRQTNSSYFKKKLMDKLFKFYKVPQSEQTCSNLVLQNLQIKQKKLVFDLCFDFMDKVVIFQTLDIKKFVNNIWLNMKGSLKLLIIIDKEDQEEKFKEFVFKKDVIVDNDVRKQLFNLYKNYFLHNKKISTHDESNISNERQSLQQKINVSKKLKQLKQSMKELKQYKEKNLTINNEQKEKTTRETIKNVIKIYNKHYEFILFNTFIQLYQKRKISIKYFLQKFKEILQSQSFSKISQQEEDVKKQGISQQQLKQSQKQLPKQNQQCINYQMKSNHENGCEYKNLSQISNDQFQSLRRYKQQWPNCLFQNSQSMKFFNYQQQQPMKSRGQCEKSNNQINQLRQFKSNVGYGRDRKVQSDMQHLDQDQSQNQSQSLKRKSQKISQKQTVIRQMSHKKRKFQSENHI